MNKVFIYGSRDRNRVPPGVELIDVTSHAKTWSMALSPFFLGPVPTYDNHFSQTMENAWQFAKVYPSYLEDDGRVGHKYFKWAIAGWNNPNAVRYPMGKDAKPLFSVWKSGEEKLWQLDYIQARLMIYIPLYVAAVRKTQAWEYLRSLYQQGSVHLFDFDGYDYINLLTGEKSLREIVLDPTRPLGHSFVLAMMLTDQIGELLHDILKLKRGSNEIHI